MIPPPSAVCGRSVRDAHDAPPGAAPFHRILQAKRLHRRGHDTFEPSTIHTPPVREHTPAEPTKTGLMPSLGGVTPVEPPVKVETTEHRDAYRVVPATGRIIDVMA